MRIYLAARYVRKAELVHYAAVLRHLGHVCSPRWLYSEHDLPAGAPPEAGLQFALEDWQDIQAADCVISFTEAPSPDTPGRARGGRHVEFGIAVALRKRVLVVGWRENVFHYLPVVEFHETFDQAASALGPQPGSWERS